MYKALCRRVGGSKNSVFISNFKNTKEQQPANRKLKRNGSDGMPFNDRELLARIIQCEAGGEGTDGMRAVATVVMNRVHVSEGEYLRTGGGNLQNVIYQPYQFDCARTQINNQYNPQNIYNMVPEPIHYEIADWALSGGVLGAVGNSLWYFNPFTSTCEDYFPRNGSGRFHTRINNHCFYRPTEKYSST